MKDRRLTDEEALRIWRSNAPGRVKRDFPEAWGRVGEWRQRYINGHRRSGEFLSKALLPATRKRTPRLGRPRKHELEERDERILDCLGEPEFAAMRDACRSTAEFCKKTALVLEREDLMPVLRERDGSLRPDVRHDATVRAAIERMMRRGLVDSDWAERFSSRRKR